MLDRGATSGLFTALALAAGIVAPSGSACAPVVKSASAISATTNEATAATAVTKTEPHVEAATAIVETAVPEPIVEKREAPPVEYDGWKGFGIGSCAYLAPKGDFVTADGGVDVVFHFHAGQMTERDIRESHLAGVFVACGYGIGGGPYASAFSDPNRFGVMVSSLLGTIARSTSRSEVHLRKLALASWSAGFAALTRILAVPRWYEATDTVMLFDSLHAPYAGDPGAHAAQAQMIGARTEPREVDTRSIGIFVRFAKDAAEGKKAMIVTHSSILPPDYASSTEATSALLDAIGVSSVTSPISNDAASGMHGMTLTRQADEGDLHVRGFRGRGPTDHFDHLHLIGEVVKSWLVPRWDEGRYTAHGEQR